MPKVTEALRRSWTNQRDQMIEEREFTQDGTPRSEEAIAEVDLEIKVHDALLALPLGTKFDAQEVFRDVQKHAAESIRDEAIASLTVDAPDEFYMLRLTRIVRGKPEEPRYEGFMRDDLKHLFPDFVKARQNDLDVFWGGFEGLHVKHEVKIVKVRVVEVEA